MTGAAWRLVALAALAGCSAALPDPESPGAQILQRRCQGCHAVPSPASMTIAMWDVQLDRMRGVFSQRGLPWLSADDERILHAYLQANAGTQ